MVLYGSPSVQLPYSVVQLHQLSTEEPAFTPSVHSDLPEIQALLSQYQHLFKFPTELPPRWACDHSIPLIPGAQPISALPYCYSPALKTEIEAQVTEMLQSGFIRPSTSAFSSPVLLVRKKDNSWHFCVDYRQLNALTMKSKFPIPIIDELLDELSGASWFSYLGLRAGFN